MTGTPQAPHDEPSRPPSRRWRGRVAAWLRRRLGRPRLLFLDDDPKRARVFLDEHPQAVWVTNVPDCLAQLAETWDEVHLDHDLGGKVYVDSSDVDCGMEVIRWLCKEPPAHLKRTRFYVHTHNATAGLLMVLLMRKGGYRAEFRPFGLDLRRLLAHNEPEAAPRRSRWIAMRDGARGMARAIVERARSMGAGAPQRAGPGSADLIQPPPSTRSS